MDIRTSPLTFLDIETTGLSPARDRIIEIAAIRVEEGKIVETFEQLVNPEQGIPPEITRITGISPAQVANAPRFYDIKDTIARLTENSIVVAHNVQFDYGFLRHEFKRYGESFSRKKVCTVQIFRQLTPELPRHNLDSLLTFFEIAVEARHRAYADTAALWEFFQRAKLRYGEERFLAAARQAMKHTRLPPAISEEQIDAIPETPGVYLMYGNDETPLYIGKSISLRDRVVSHFADVANSSKEFSIAQQVQHIETIETAGELSALLLEAQLVKQLQPLYNRQLRKVSKLIAAKKILQDKTYATVTLEQIQAISPEILPHLISVFRSTKQAKDTLLSIAKKHTLCPRLLGLESGSGSCFWHQLGWCKGACIEKESPASYNLRFVEAFSQYTLKRWPYNGPIVVRESSAEKQSGVVIDHWCVLGVISTEDELKDLPSAPYLFDLDTYRILSRYLFSMKHQVHITELHKI